MAPEPDKITLQQVIEVVAKNLDAMERAEAEAMENSVLFKWLGNRDDRKPTINVGRSTKGDR